MAGTPACAASRLNLLLTWSGGRAEASGPNPVELFKMTCGWFTEDVDSALADVGVYDEQRDQIMARLGARAGLRLRQSGGLILEQIKIMAGAGPQAQERG